MNPLAFFAKGCITVSYTHLDVYKRQAGSRPRWKAALPGAGCGTDGAIGRWRAAPGWWGCPGSGGSATPVSYTHLS